MHAIDQDYEKFILQLENKYVSGLGHLQGGHILQEEFNCLRLWVRSAAHFKSWENTPFRMLGNELLTKVRVQYHYVVDKVPHRNLRLQLEKDSPATNSVAKAAASYLARGSGRPSRPSKAAPSARQQRPLARQGKQGNAGAGET